MGVPMHLPRDRGEAVSQFVAKGGVGPPPIGPTQEDIHEKNARPVVRFERQLPVLFVPTAAPTSVLPGSSNSNTCTSTCANPTTAFTSPTASAPNTATSTNAAIDAHLAVDPELDLDLDSSPYSSRYGNGDEGRSERRDRWATYRWRARLCTGYATPAGPNAGGASAGVHGHGRGTGGVPPGRIGRVYALGSFAGLWAGTMLMPSEPPYTALVVAPGGALPEGGLASDDFVAAARPVYMRMQEHWSFHPHTPAPPPPPDSTTADEGLHEGWLPPGARVVGVGGGEVEVRVPAVPLRTSTSIYPTSSFSTSTSAAPRPGPDGWGAGAGVGEMRGRGRSEETRYTYHTPLHAHLGTAAREHSAHDWESCPGCVRVRERKRWERARYLEGETLASASFAEYAGEEEWEGDGEEVEDIDMEMQNGVSLSYASRSSEARALTSEERSASPLSGSTPSSFQERSASPRSQVTSIFTDPDASQDSTNAHWPEWSAPAWAAHRFEDDKGWEGACDGVQDVVFTGETDPRHGAAWHHYEYSGRVRPWDGLIGLVMRPRDRTLGLATYFISGHLVGRDTFEGTWQLAAQDVLAPSWGGSICLARG
ncbi:hypothetical protein B0H13DRAFT_927143 [Mycena leptocephala]|nr:hypothetical protein B0H13DRAFT_927143 [Mycena leptocephala]